jgi:hypothetical protein
MKRVLRGQQPFAPRVSAILSLRWRDAHAFIFHGRLAGSGDCIRIAGLGNELSVSGLSQDASFYVRS